MSVDGWEVRTKLIEGVNLTPSLFRVPFLQLNAITAVLICSHTDTHTGFPAGRQLANKRANASECLSCLWGEKEEKVHILYEYVREVILTESNHKLRQIHHFNFCSVFTFIIMAFLYKLSYHTTESWNHYDKTKRLGE